MLPQTNSRRELLSLSARGLIATAAAGSLAASKAGAQVGQFAISYASWTHGNTLEVQFLDRLTSITRLGFGTLLEGRPGTYNWFHLAIPTPVIINDVRLRLSCVMLRFTTGSSDTYVTSIHVYDGEILRSAVDNLALWGEQPFYRVELPDRPAVLWGLGVSIGVGFGLEAMDHTMLFRSAGANLVA